MANKEHHSEKDIKNYYKTEISRLEKELNQKDHIIYDLRIQIKCLENKLKNKRFASRKKEAPKTAIEKALEIRDRLSKERKPEEE